MASRYPDRSAVQWQPEPASVRTTYEAGYLREHIAVGKLLLAIKDHTAEPVYRIAHMTGLNKRVVEKAASSMGLTLIYMDAHYFAPKSRGARRCVAVDHEAVREYIAKVRRFRDKMRGKNE